jgi:hypothetical protein
MFNKLIVSFVLRTEYSVSVKRTLVPIWSGFRGFAPVGSDPRPLILISRVHCTLR